MPYPSIFWDIPNLSFVLFFVFVMFLRTGYHRKHPKLSIIILLTPFLPFLTNYVIFDPSYMPDQFKYLAYSQQARRLDFSDHWHGNVQLSSYIMALVPLPAIETVRSLGLTNKLIFITLFFSLYRTGKFHPTAQAFYLLYPSLQLYSALALRDTLIFSFMMISAYFLVSRKSTLSLGLSTPLFFIKYQNFLIFVLFSIISHFYSKSKSGLSLHKLLIFLIIPVLIVVLGPWALPIINTHRKDMWVEDGGHPQDITYLTGYSDLIVQTATGWLQFLMRPYPWETTNFVQIIQSFENIIVAVFLISITRKAYKKNADHAIIWVFFLIFSLGIYSLVVSNFGTASRYKFSFVCVFVFGIFSNIYKSGK